MAAVPGTQVIEHVFQSAAVATGDGTALDVMTNSAGAFMTLGVQVEGITTATVTFEGTIDGTNWIAIQFTNLNDGTAATTATADGLYRATVSGLSQVRARISAWTTGTLNVRGLLVAR